MIISVIGLFCLCLLLSIWLIASGLERDRSYRSDSAPVFALFYRLEHGPWYLRKPDGLKLPVDGANSHSIWTLSDESDFGPALDVITDEKTRTVSLLALHPKMDEYMDHDRLDEFKRSISPWWKVRVSQPKNGESVG